MTSKVHAYPECLLFFYPECLLFSIQNVFYLFFFGKRIRPKRKGDETPQSMSSWNIFNSSPLSGDILLLSSLAVFFRSFRFRVIDAACGIPAWSANELFE